MKRKGILSAVVILVSANIILAWGVWGHSHINHAAVFALPEDMRLFFYNHIDFITEESTVPDLRKYTIKDKAEFPRHFIDLEDYELPIDQLPRNMKEATEKYDEKTLQERGTLPWTIQEVMNKLTDAFKKGRRNEILFLAGDLGHYIADAHMPLHTSTNHDGQLTGQKGIHSFWESQLPEYYGGAYNFKVNDAVYQKDVTLATWAIIQHSHSLKDSLLSIEKRIMATIPEDKLYKRDGNGKVVKNMFDRNVYSEDFALAYHKALDGMVESQMRKAIQTLANFWFTAWVNAGQPDLSKLDTPEVTESNRKKYKKELELYRKGKVSGFLPEREF